MNLPVIKIATSGVLAFHNKAMHEASYLMTPKRAQSDLLLCMSCRSGLVRQITLYSHGIELLAF